MANNERDPLDLVAGGALIVLNLGLTVAGAHGFAGGVAGFVGFIVVPGVLAWACSCLIRRCRQRPDRVA